MCVGVAEHFRGHCWTIAEGTGDEVGFLGRVGKPLSKALSHQGADMLRCLLWLVPTWGAGAAAVRFGKKTSASSQLGVFSSTQLFYISGFLPAHHLSPVGNSPWCLALNRWSGWTQRPGSGSSPTGCNGHSVGRWG